jgi:hypothetical protein
MLESTIARKNSEVEWMEKILERKDKVFEIHKKIAGIQQKVDRMNVPQLLEINNN